MEASCACWRTGARRSPATTCTTPVAGSRRPRSAGAGCAAFRVVRDSVGVAGQPPWPMVPGTMAPLGDARLGAGRNTGVLAFTTSAGAFDEQCHPIDLAARRHGGGAAGGAGAGAGADPANPAVRRR